MGSLIIKKVYAAFEEGREEGKLDLSNKGMTDAQFKYNFTKDA